MGQSAEFQHSDIAICPERCGSQLIQGRVQSMKICSAALTDVVDARKTGTIAGMCKCETAYGMTQGEAAMQGDVHLLQP